MNKNSFVFLAIISTVVSSKGSMVTNAFSSTSATASYCPPIYLDEVQQHVIDARDALNDGKLIQATSKLDIGNSLLDQLDDMTRKSDYFIIYFKYYFSILNRVIILSSVC